MMSLFSNLSLHTLQALRTTLVVVSICAGVIVLLVENRITFLEEGQSQQSDNKLNQLTKENLDLRILSEENRITVNGHLADRDILASQTEILKGILKPIHGAKLELSVVPNDAEAAKFADELRKAFVDSGLILSLAGHAPAWQQTPKGFGLVIGTARQGDADILRDALKKSGIAQNHIPSKPKGETMGLELFVGPKP